MKIDIFTLDYTLGGGIERVVSNMAWMFSEHPEFEIRIVSAFRSSEDIKFPLPSSVQLVCLSNNKYDLTSLRKKILSNIKLSKCIYGYSSDALIISTTTNITQWLSILGKTKKQKVIAAEHGYYWAFGSFSRFLRKYTYRKVDAVVTLTKSEINNYEPFTKRVVCIPNSLSFYSDEENTYNSKRVIAAGRAVKEKGFDQLLDVYISLGRKYPNWTFDLFSGEGYLLGKLKEQVKVAPQNVHLLPASKNLKYEFLNGEIYVCSSYTESFSMVILEAAACGMCIVTYDCPPGPREIVTNGDDGIIVPLNDKAALEQSLEMVIKDKNQRMTLGRKAKQNISKYLPSNVYIMWDKLIKEVVSER